MDNLELSRDAVDAGEAATLLGVSERRLWLAVAELRIRCGVLAPPGLIGYAIPIEGPAPCGWGRGCYRDALIAGDLDGLGNRYRLRIHCKTHGQTYDVDEARVAGLWRLPDPHTYDLAASGAPVRLSWLEPFDWEERHRQHPECFPGQDFTMYVYPERKRGRVRDDVSTCIARGDVLFRREDIISHTSSALAVVNNGAAAQKGGKPKRRDDVFPAIWRSVIVNHPEWADQPKALPDSAKGVIKSIAIKLHFPLFTDSTFDTWWKASQLRKSICDLATADLRRQARRSNRDT